jgi:hypothetical protein
MMARRHMRMMAHMTVADMHMSRMMRRHAEGEMGRGWQLATGGSVMTKGLHYWEVKIMAVDTGNVMVGAAPPGLDHDRGHCLDAPRCESGEVRAPADAVGGDGAGGGESGKGAAAGKGAAGTPVDGGPYFIWARDGSLCGKGRLDTGHSRYYQGDRVGCLLDLDAGFLVFFRNGQLVRGREGFKQVVGPLVLAVQLRNEGTAVAVVQGAVVPARFFNKDSLAQPDGGGRGGARDSVLAGGGAGGGAGHSAGGGAGGAAGAGEDLGEDLLRSVAEGAAEGAAHGGGGGGGVPAVYTALRLI